MEMHTSMSKSFFVQNMLQGMRNKKIWAVLVIVCYTNNSLLLFFLTNFVFYFIMELITNRGFKKMRQSILRYSVIMISVLVVMLSISRTSLFGAALHERDVSKVSAIEIEYSVMFWNLETPLTIKDPETIDAILRVQQQVIDKYKERKSSYTSLLDWDMAYSFELENRSGRIRDISMRIMGTDGSTDDRCYRLPYEQINEMKWLRVSYLRYILHRISSF